MLISSTQNPHIKQIKSLSSRKNRKQTGLYFIEGIRLVGEAVQLKTDIETLVTAPDLLSSTFGQGIVTEAVQTGTPTLDVTPDVFRRLSGKDGPQGLGAVVRQRWETLESVEAGASLGWVVLDEVRNPGNLGTILRSCDAVGCTGVILLGDTADPYDPAAVRAGMGAHFSQQLVRTDPEAFAAWKQPQTLTMIGTSDAASTDYQQIAYHPPILLCMGNEQHGLSDDHMALCDEMVRIPMVGRSDSLNLAVATSVILYEIFNQNR